MQKRPKSAVPVSTDDVRNLGGKDLILRRLVNHYTSLGKAKAVVDTSPPFAHINKSKPNWYNDIHYKEEYYNVRQTYKKVASVKPYVDSNKPFTYEMSKNSKPGSQKEKFEDMEHIRRLEAMNKRMLSIGKPHERKKNLNDPIANPTYFFRKPEDKRAIKLISLSKFQEKLQQLNSIERNKLLLGGVIGSTIKNSKKNAPITRAKSASLSYAIKFPDKKTQVNNKPLNIQIDPQMLINTHLQDRQKSAKHTGLPEGQTIIRMNKTTKPTEEMNQFNTKTKICFPLYDKTAHDPSADFEIKIVKYIVANRIFKEKDMEMLLKQLIMKNIQLLPADEVQRVFELVKKDLEE